MMATQTSLCPGTAFSGQLADGHTDTGGTTQVEEGELPYLAVSVLPRRAAEEAGEVFREDKWG